MATAGLFNEYGIRRPYDGLKNIVGEPDWKFRFSAPQLFGRSLFAQPLAQFAKHLPAGSKLPELADFYSRFMAIVETVSGREDVSGILNGPCLPLVFAAGAIRIDLGAYLENTVLPAVKSAYEGRFAGRPFYNYLKGGLADLDYVPESNFELLLKAMDDGPVVAAYFPDALRAWSNLAGREQMDKLPPDMKFVLPDTIVHSHAIIGYPDTMACGYQVPRQGGYYQVPRQDCVANTFRSALWCSLGFWAYDDGLVFRSTDDLAGAYGDCSGGLMLIG